MHRLAKFHILAVITLVCGCTGASDSPKSNNLIKKPAVSACNVSDRWNGDSAGYRISTYAATDSASAATAMATGYKTVSGAISMVPGPGHPGDVSSVKTIAEHFRERGSSVGVVTSVPFNHATPAAFLSHVKDRGEYNNIAKQMLGEFQADVIIGGGHPSTSGGHYFSEKLWNEILENKNGAYSEYDVIGASQCRIAGIKTECSPKAQLEKSARSGTNRLFAALPGSLSCNKCGAGKKYARGILVPPRYRLDPDLASASYDFKSPDSKFVDSLKLEDVVKTALGVLESRSEGKGSFLLVEGGDVDWANHSNDFAWLLASMHEFEEAVKEVAAYLDGPSKYNWDNTLVIVTADHANSFMRIDPKVLRRFHSSGETPKQRWLEQNRKTRNGVFNDGEWFYGDNGSVPVNYETIDHTNELVTIVARGRGAETIFAKLEKSRPCGAKAVPGLVDNTQIFVGILQAAQDLGVENVILMVGDGMHKAHESAYSIVRYGNEDLLEWDKWSRLPDEDCYKGRVTTWDISTYDWYACNNGVDPFTQAGCESQVGYDESFTPVDSVSIGATLTKGQEYFLTAPRRAK